MLIALRQNRFWYLRQLKFEDVAAQWCDSLTLQPGQSGGVGLIPGRVPSLGRHYKVSWNRLGLLYFCDSSAWR